MKQIRQFRYYNEKNTAKNQPANIDIRNLISGSIFAPYMPVIQLGIQGLPGTKFYLNSATDPVIIGLTGIYELDLDGLSEIDALSFDYDSIHAIEDNDNAYLIVDIIWEDGEG